MYYKRTIDKILDNVENVFESIVIYGPRQVGKSTTLAQRNNNKYKVVSLDDVQARKLANENPEQFLKVYNPPVIIDEIQKAPNLLSYIKMYIDNYRLEAIKTNRKKENLFYLTGSQQFELQQSVSESLAGRIGVLFMNSFSRYEILQKDSKEFLPDIDILLRTERERENDKDTENVFNRIFKGGMPSIVVDGQDRDLYFQGYLNSYIEKDIKQLINISLEHEYINFLSILAMRTGQQINYNDLSNAIGVDVRTIKRWLSILETSGMIILVQPFFANISNSIIKAPKLYFMDTGLCAYLCKIPTAEFLENSMMAGAFYETYVVSEIYKSHYHNGKNPKWYLYYYRDTHQKEIDLIFYQMDKITPIEIKKSVKPTRASKNFKVLEKYGKEITDGFVICRRDNVMPINDNVYEIPDTLIGL